jgi:hypothetical protein
VCTQQEGNSTLTTPGNTENTNPAIPTAAQLSETRLKQWHQQGEALLTIENLRSWINTAGLVLFVPRPQIAAPAPSLVEGVLGTSTPTPTIEETTEARSLLARLVAEGFAVPLNLLGAVGSAVGDTPDFVASTAVFSYVFTLRGDKAWKQPPTTSGAFKVSPLAAATHEALTRRGPLSAYDLTTELGKEVTEAAVLRALNELWAHLRVLPLAQAGENATLWELTGARFGKQIKAGANAGQPSALSALISLYLGQAAVASEDEIESFLSPLASRSRIRDVIHALLSARQLETIAVEGRTVLHVAGSLPAFLAPESAVVVEGETQAVDGEIAVEAESAEGAPRIAKYIPKPRKIGTGYLAKAKPANFGESALPAAKPGPFERGRKAGFGGKPAFGSRPAFGAKPGFTSKPAYKAGFNSRVGSEPAPDRERRPFSKPAAGGFKTGGFDRPWEEEKRRRLSAIARPSAPPAEAQENVADLAATGDSAATFQPRKFTPRSEGSGERRGFGGKPAFGRKPSFGGKPSFGSKPAFGRKPSFGGKPRFDSDSRPPRRDIAARGDFAPRSEGQSSDARPPRKTFSKPGTFGRKREGFSGRPDFGGDSRPPRRDFAPRSDSRPDSRSGHGERSAFGGSRSGESYTPRAQSDRPARGSEGGDFAPRKSFGERPAFGGSRGGGSGYKGKSSFTGKPSFSKDRKPFAGKPFADKLRDGGERGFTGESGKRVYRKFDAPRDRPARPFSSDRPARAESSGEFTKRASGDFAPRKFTGQASGFAGKKPFDRSSGSGFAGKKPFGKSSGKPGGFGGNKPFGKTGASFTGKPGSTFAKFVGNKKPFGNRPPARKYKPKGDESA